jgi:hypothetical protein
MPITRSRRRILIATLVVVVLVGGAWWWSRPRVDPRFFGHWDVYAWSNAWPDGMPERLTYENVVLHPNGTGQGDFRMGGGGGGGGGGNLAFQTLPVEWRIDSEGRLIMRPRPTLERRLCEEFRVILALFGTTVRQPMSMTIVEATKDRIVVENVKRPGEFFIYRRELEPPTETGQP